MEEPMSFPVSNKFMVAVYFTMAVWVWWVHGRKTWNIKLAFEPITEEEEATSKNRD